MQLSAAHTDADPSLAHMLGVCGTGAFCVLVQGRLPDYNDPVVLPSNRNTVSQILDAHNAPSMLFLHLSFLSSLLDLLVHLSRLYQISSISFYTV